MSDLLELAVRVEALTVPDTNIDHAIADEIGEWINLGGWRRRHKVSGKEEGYTYVPASAYTASFDAAMTLVPEGWQGERVSWWTLGGASCELLESHQVNGQWVREMGWLGRAEGKAATPALALCAAALRARAARGSKPVRVETGTGSIEDESRAEGLAQTSCEGPSS